MLNSKIYISNNIHNNNIGNLSFKGVAVPYRLGSPNQDNFHATSNQIRIRQYLELAEQGLNDDAIIKQIFNITRELTEQELKEYRSFLDKLRNQIKENDDAFKKIIPMMLPKTYYRGVYSTNENRYITSILNAKKGDVIKPDLGYPFATSEKSHAEEYAKSTSGEKTPGTSILMEIKTPAGVKLARDIQYSSKVPFKDNVVVFPRGVSYEVLDKQEKDGMTYIKLRYLEADGLK